MKVRTIALVSAVALSATLFAVASAGTGAFLNDTKSGVVTGTPGTVVVTTWGGSGTHGLDLNWDNMLPGVTYSAGANFRNDGSTAQDVWLVFPNKTALSAFNAKGRYAAFGITSSEGYNFYSNNLNDHPVDQGVPAAPDDRITRGVPQMVQIATNMAPGAGGSLTFKYQQASGTKVMPPVFNLYPRVTPGTPAGNWWTVPPGDPAAWPGDGTQAGYDQNYANAADGSGVGLPYDIVATQPGIRPDDAGQKYAAGW